MALGTLLRVARNVTDLARTCAFYEHALGFVGLGRPCEEVVLAEVLGVSTVLSARLRLGAQVLELTQCGPAGAPYPRDAQSDDPLFQHIAIVTTDIHRAAAQALRAGAIAISAGGPQRLPAKAGGAWAWKFRDPDGHPLELLQFPSDSRWSGDALQLGYDHSAISVADVERSIGFYSRMGLHVGDRHRNHGAEQGRLDGLAVSVVEVVALIPPGAPPHVELLGYRGREARVTAEMRANDLAADRLVFCNTAGEFALARDPDGHFLLLDGSKQSLC